MADLSRNVSIRTDQSEVTRHDGHSDGNLNFIASRHGWTRTFSLDSSEVVTLDYTTLEAVIELNTLKLRSTQLRVFVENPPNSGTWSKIRYWKDDGSLQSVLCKQFFADRMHSGVITKLDIRDGHDREDAMSMKSAGGSIIHLPGALHRPGHTKEWISQRKTKLVRTLSSRRGGTQTEDEDDDVPPQEPPQPATRLQAIKLILGLSSTAPPPPPKTEEELAQEQQKEEEALRKRGWMPPMLRRMTSRKSRKHSSNPFFGGGGAGSTASLVRGSSRLGDIEDNGSGEELNLGEGEGPPQAPKEKAQGGKWFNFLGPSSPAIPAKSTKVEENPFADAHERKNKGLVKLQGKGKKKQSQQQLKGAQVVGKPSEAFENGPVAEEEEV